MKYNATIMDHFNAPRNAGALGDATVVGEVQNEVCLDRLRLYLRLDKTGWVSAATFQAEGCVPTLAVGSFLTQYLVGKSVEELQRIDAEQIEQALGGLPATKKHAAYLGAEAVIDAVGKWKSKNEG